MYIYMSKNNITIVYKLDILLDKYQKSIHKIDLLKN